MSLYIWTTKGLLDTKLLSVRGTRLWTEYRYHGELVRRDAQAPLKGNKIKGTHGALALTVAEVPDAELRKYGLRADFEHDGVQEDNR